ncbi:MAG: DUF5107 domain-containing protein [bacterium]
MPSIPQMKRKQDLYLTYFTVAADHFFPRRSLRVLTCILFLSPLLVPGAWSDAPGEVRAWEEALVIPTYQLGPPDPNPMFYTQESYQGAQKRIYPYALQDHLTHVKKDQTYNALYLENEYLQLIVLPEIGGRLFSAVDKTNGYPFFYRQHVIKPALIGMLGAWISGGIEWCVFHHHRNTTFMPVDHRIAENADGSKTLWIGETERRHRMKWLIGITLRPGQSYIEVTGKFFNRTALPHSILYWANVAVHVNDDYQVYFPPSVQVATYHSKVDFTHWPISNEIYRGSNYKGVDLSWWKNSEASNSFFAWDRQEDFMGGYDHGQEAGVVHVGNHHVVTGAKLWEWGTGPAGRMWDKILTDEDGPYAELMVGAFSDNQPDYSWIKPSEIKTFKQYWFPVRGIGGFKNANLNGAVNLELKSENRAWIGFHATTKRDHVKAVLKAGDQVLFEQETNIGPAEPFTREVEIPTGTAETDLRAALLDEEGRELIAYQPVKLEPVSELPEVVKAPPAPADIQTNEELVLTGLRVEQIHNPSVDPLAYYEEALKRDPGDSRANTLLAINEIKRGQYAEAEGHLRAAIERISEGYTRPQNAEAHYYLGLALRAQEKWNEAIDHFYRATWDAAFHSPAYAQLAELSCHRGDYPQALEQLDQALVTNAQFTKAMNLKAAVLRRMGKPVDAKPLAEAVLAIDPIDFFAMNELYLARKALGYADAETALTDLRTAMRDEAQAYLELATDYLNAGLFDEAIDVLKRPVEGKMAFAGTYPLVYYYLGYFHQQKGQPEQAAAYYQQAAAMPPDYCFPFRLETLAVLDAALAANPNDARAYYYKGNLLYDLQPENAMTCWEKSRALDDSLATVHRNLGWVYSRIQNDMPKAIACYEKAIACGGLDPRLFLELDMLYESANATPEKRLAALEKNHATVVQRVESFTREIRVLVLNGKYDQAIDYLADNFFHVSEGNEEIHDIYADAHLLKGLQEMKGGRNAEALAHFQKASEYPENLSVGRPQNDPRASQVAYFIGTAFEALGESAKAKEAYQQAVDQSGSQRWQEPNFYKALSLAELGQNEEAAQLFAGLIDRGARTLSREGGGDFFAKFGEQQTRRTRQATGHFLQGLGFLGQGEKDKAKEEFRQAVELNQSHLWARYQLSEL